MPERNWKTLMHRLETDSLVLRTRVTEAQMSVLIKVVLCRWLRVRIHSRRLPTSNPPGSTGGQEALRFYTEPKNVCVKM